MSGDPSAGPDARRSGDSARSPSDVTPPADPSSDEALLAPPPAGRRSTNGDAVASLAAGVASLPLAFLAYPFVGVLVVGVGAVVLGAAALRQIRRDRRRGRGIAVAGIVTGAAGLAAGTLYLLTVVGVRQSFESW